MKPALRELLETVAFGSDPRLTPDHRLRAAEQLRQLGPDEMLPGDIFRAELAELDGEQLQAELDSLVAAVFVSQDDDARCTAWPRTMMVLGHEVDERVTERSTRERAHQPDGVARSVRAPMT